MIGAVILIWLAYVGNALLWSAAAVGVLGAITLALGLCRASKGSGEEQAINLEIEQ